MQSADYFQSPADCGACGSPVMNRAGQWECSVCGIPTDYATGESGVSRGNPTGQKPRIITLNGGLNTQDLRTPAERRDTLAGLIEQEENEQAVALAAAVDQELAPVAVASPAYQPVRSGKRR